MQGTIQSYVLYMADDVKKEPLKVKQCDTNSRWAKITLKAFEGEYWLIPFDVQIYLNVHKADGTLATATCTKVDEHTVLAPITEQMTAVTGTQSGELYFLAQDGDIKSQTFPIAVYPMVMDQARIESSDDFQSLQDALRQVQTSTDAADIAAQYATEQGNQARDGAQRANDAADSIQVAVDAAANAKACESNAKNSELAAAQTQQEVTDYVEAQKAAFVGYSQRESDSKYANALTETATGEGGVTVEDAWTSPVLGLDVAGKSEQVVTTGAQLFDASRIATMSGGGATVTNNGDGSFTVSGSGTLTSVCQKSYVLTHDESIRLFPAGVYTMTRSPAYPYCYVQANRSGSSSGTLVSTDSENITITEAMIADITYRITIGFYGASGKAIVPGIIKPMVNAGDTLKPWEPYTGGAPSPSPDYPQDIISVGTVSTGAQLLDFEQCLKEWNSKYTQSSGRVYTVNALGTGFQNPISFSDEDIKVTLSGKVRDISGSRYRIELLDSSGNLVGRIDKDAKSITVMASKIRLNFTEGGAGEYADIMLNAGDTALPWEPYTGGKPSPSVEYPQEVKVTATGANLLKYPYGSATMTINGVTFTDNCDGTITANGTATQNAYYYLDNNSGNAHNVLGKNVWLSGCPAGGSLQTYVLQWFNYDGSLSAARDFGKGINFTVSKAAANNYNIVIVIMAGVTANNLVFRPMLNTGSAPKPWEPYRSGIAPITLIEPLRSIGDYRDRIACRDGVWGIERKVGHTVITGETSGAMIGSVNGEFRRVYYSTEKITLPIQHFPALCNKLEIETDGAGSYGKFFFNTHPDWGEARIVIVMPASIDSEVKMKEWLIEVGGLEFYYAIIGSTKFELLPDATQQALNELTTYAGTTHLTITAGGPAAEVALEYVKDTHKALEQCQEAAKEYTDTQIAAIVAALPTATQAAIVDNQTTRLLQEV